MNNKIYLTAVLSFSLLFGGCAANKATVGGASGAAGGAIIGRQSATTPAALSLVPLSVDCSGISSVTKWISLINNRSAMHLKRAGPTSPLRGETLILAGHIQLHQSGRTKTTTAATAAAPQ